MGAQSTERKDKRILVKRIVYEHECIMDLFNFNVILMQSRQCVIYREADAKDKVKV